MTFLARAASTLVLLAAGGALADPWWKCPQVTDTQRWWSPARGSHEKPRTPEQERRLDDFGFDRFAVHPKQQSRSKEFSRADLIRRYGKPLSVNSRKEAVDRFDPPWILTTWEYAGFRIVTAAAEARPTRLRIWSGEVFDARVPLGQDVRVGQPIEQWERQFGRPDCDRDHLTYVWWDNEFECGDHPCRDYFAMHIQIDASGRVASVKWLHSGY